jgi:hypothetical protein
MSNWTRTLTVIVPESLIVQANQLALAIGTSPDDVNTFRSADWTDGTANYAVAHTQAVEQIMKYFALVPVELASGVVFPTIITNTDGVTTLTGSDMAKVQVFVDCEPFTVFNLLNITRRDVSEIEA